MQTLERQLSAVREDEDGDVGGDAAEGIRAMEGSEGMVRELLEALYFDLAPMKGLVAGLMEEVKVVGLERVVRWLETAEEREMGGFESLWGRGGQVGCWLSWRNGEAVVMDVVGLGLW